MGNNQTITLFSFSLYRPTSFMRLLLFLSSQIKFQQIIKSSLGTSVTNIISCQWLICLFHHRNHKLWTLFNTEASFCCPQRLQEKWRHGWLPCSSVQGLLLLPSFHWLPLLPPGLKGREKRRTHGSGQGRWSYWLVPFWQWNFLTVFKKLSLRDTS